MSQFRTRWGIPLVTYGEEKGWWDWFEIRRAGDVSPYIVIRVRWVLGFEPGAVSLDFGKEFYMCWKVKVTEKKRASEVTLRLNDNSENHPSSLVPEISVKGSTSPAAWQRNAERNRDVLRELSDRWTNIAVMAAGGNGFKIRASKLAWMFLYFVGNRNRTKAVTVDEIRALRSRLGK